MPENSRNFQNRNRLGAARRRLTSFRDAFRSSRIFVCQEMTISLAVPDILVARAKSGDLEALEALYRAFETPVYNLALRMLRRSEDAEDVLQETFLEVVRSIRQYRGEGHLWGWVRQITVSKTLMRIRRGQLRDTEELHEEYTQGGSGLGVGRVRVVSRGARGAVSTRGAAQGAARAPAGAGPLARRARRRAGRAAAPARALGRAERGRSGCRRGADRVPSVLDGTGGGGRAGSHQAAVGHARAAAPALRAGRARDERS